MTLPAWRETQQEPKRRRPRPRPADELDGLRDRASSPANQLLEMLQDAQLTKPPAPKPARKPKLSQKVAGWMLGWSLLALTMSVGYLAFETLRPTPAAAEIRPTLDFSQVSSRYVQSSQGPAVELSGIVRNVGEEGVEPEVTLQLAGSRVAIEEALRLGPVALPPGAERPFTVRILLPEGTKSVSLLPPKGAEGAPRSLLAVSPGWTASR